MKSIVNLTRGYWIYLFLLLLGLAATTSLYYAFAPAIPENIKTTVQPGQSIVTRSAVDSTSFVQQQQYTIKQEQPTEKPFDFSAIGTTIIAVMGMAQVYANKKSSIKLERFEDRLTSIEVSVGNKFISIFEVIKQYQDEQFKKDVDTRLRQVEYDVSGFIEDSRVRTLIEGIATRTRAFSRDVMQHYFDKDAMSIAENKINARASECAAQVDALGYNDTFQREVDAIRETHIQVLKTELKALAEDNQYNDKYNRFNDIVCRFLKNFTMSVIKLHIQSNGATN